MVLRLSATCCVPKKIDSDWRSLIDITAALGGFEPKCPHLCFKHYDIAIYPNF